MPKITTSTYGVIDSAKIFLIVRRLIVRLTPYRAIIPNRNMKYVMFAVENIATSGSGTVLNILDIGGKYGHQSNLLLNALQNRGYNPSPVVLDINPKAIAKGKRLHSRLNFVLGDAQYLPFRSDTFHLVCSYSLLEHLKSPILAVKEQARVCKDTIVVEIPNLQYFIEPHSKAPLLFYYPEKVRDKVIEITKPTATQINFTAVYKNIVKWFRKDGAELVRHSKVYHLNWTRILILPQGFLLSFKKTTKTCIDESENKNFVDKEVHIAC